uniref:Disease resistance protein At4g27190-like leucine-rich repeats domain-containing protein n=1 Tax=Salix viminalis TaxID=40686 RepID=A0A6N2KBP8_SALVM
MRYRGSGSKMVVLGNLNINRDADFLVISSNDIQQLICECIDARSIGDVLPLKYSLSSCNSMESLVSSSWFCSAPLPQPSSSYNGIFSALKLLSCYGCKSMKKLFPSVLLPNLVNLEEIEVDDCEKMEEIIGGTRLDEEGAMGEESSEFKLPKLRKLILSNLPELKSISSAKLICNSLKNIDVHKCNSIEILFPSSWSCLLNLEEITVVKCEKIEKIIGGTRSDERVMGKESISSEFKLPKLRDLNLVDLPELKSICNAKLICDSLKNITVCHCEKLGNGQPSPPASLRSIWIYPEEWWESTVEWEHPNAPL